MSTSSHPPGPKNLTPLSPGGHDARSAILGRSRVPTVLATKHGTSLVTITASLLAGGRTSGTCNTTALISLEDHTSMVEVKGSLCPKTTILHVVCNVTSFLTLGPVTLSGPAAVGLTAVELAPLHFGTGPVSSIVA